MLKQAQIEDINDLNYYYITTIAGAQIQTLINKNIIQLALFEDELMEVEHLENEKTIRYIIRRNPVRALEIKASRTSKIETITKKIKEQIKMYSLFRYNALTHHILCSYPSCTPGILKIKSTRYSIHI